jgi:hypothetical protein
MNQIFFLFIILVLVIGLSIYFNIIESFGSEKIYDNFSNYYLEKEYKDNLFPKTETNVLVGDIYPPIGKNQLSNDTSFDIWWHYPTFKLGSYKQITNNLKYSYNPDIGRCMPANICGALYHDKFIKSNYIHPLPPLNPKIGTRVGYYDTNIQLIDSLPYKTSIQNILY